MSVNIDMLLAFGFRPTDEDHIPQHIREALDGWGNGAHPYTGDFLRAVLSNDLREAVGRADEHNLIALPAIVAYCYNNLPGACWGSPERYAEWAKKHRTPAESAEGTR